MTSTINADQIEKMKKHFTTNSGNWLYATLGKERFAMLVNAIENNIKQEEISDKVVAEARMQIKQNAKGLFFVRENEINAILEAMGRKVFVPRKTWAYVPQLVKATATGISYSDEFMKKFIKVSSAGDVCATYATLILENAGYALPTVNTWNLPPKLEKRGWKNVSDTIDWYRAIYKSANSKNVKEVEELVKRSVDAGRLSQEAADKINKYAINYGKTNDEQLLEEIHNVFKAEMVKRIEKMPDGSVMLVHYAKSQYKHTAYEILGENPPTHTIVKMNGKWYQSIGGKPSSSTSQNILKFFELRDEKISKDNPWSIRMLYEPPEPSIIQFKSIRKSLPAERGVYDFLAAGKEISNEVYGTGLMKWYFAGQLFKAHKQGKTVANLVYPIYGTKKIELTGHLEGSKNAGAAKIVEQMRDAYGKSYSEWQLEMLGHTLAEEFFKKSTGYRKMAKEKLTELEATGKITVQNIEEIREIPASLKRYMKKYEGKKITISENYATKLEDIVNNKTGRAHIAVTSVGVTQSRPDIYIDWMRDDPQIMHKVFKKIYDFALSSEGSRFFSKTEVKALKLLSEMDEKQMQSQQVVQVKVARRRILLHDLVRKGMYSIAENAEGKVNKLTAEIIESIAAKIMNATPEELKKSKIANLVLGPGQIEKMDLEEATPDFRVAYEYDEKTHAYFLLRTLMRDNKYFACAMYMEHADYIADKIQKERPGNYSKEDLGFIIMMSYHGGFRRWKNATNQYLLIKCAEKFGIEIPNNFYVDGKWGKMSDALFNKVLAKAKEENFPLPAASEKLREGRYRILAKIYEVQNKNEEAPTLPKIADIPKKYIRKYYLAYVDAQLKHLKEKEEINYEMAKGKVKETGIAGIESEGFDEPSEM